MVATENELLKEIELKKIHLRNETRDLEGFQAELAAAKTADEKYANARKKVRDLLCQDPIPIRDASKAKAEMLKAYPATTSHRAIDRIQADISEREKRIANINAEIAELAEELAEGWLAE